MYRASSLTREDFSPAMAAGAPPGGPPSWLKQRVGPETAAVLRLMRELRLHTVCLSASCPNIGECYGEKRAAFLILGGTCTRNCRFCAVPHGQGEELDRQEPKRLVEAIKRLSLRHVVITSVTRDDLDDGGAGQFVRCLEVIRKECPGVTTEVLVPDFSGNMEALEGLLEAGPEVFNHNIETVPRLYSQVRPRADYGRSREILQRAAEAGRSQVKTGLMLGLGEEEEEVREVLADLVRIGVSSLTLGQYLRPSPNHWPVAEYIRPERFLQFKQLAYELGFARVAAGPLVRSSYHAHELYQSGIKAKGGIA